MTGGLSCLAPRVGRGRGETRIGGQTLSEQPVRQRRRMAVRDRDAHAEVLPVVEVRVVENGESLAFEEHAVVFRGFREQGLNSARLSPNLFNTEEEIGRFFELATV